LSILTTQQSKCLLYPILIPERVKGTFLAFTANVPLYCPRTNLLLFFGTPFGDTGYKVYIFQRKTKNTMFLSFSLFAFPSFLLVREFDGKVWNLAPPLVMQTGESNSVRTKHETNLLSNSRRTASPMTHHLPSP